MFPMGCICRPVEHDGGGEGVKAKEPWEKPRMLFEGGVPERFMHLSPEYAGVMPEEKAKRIRALLAAEDAARDEAQARGNAQE